jgi:hypothetical protein
MTGEQSNWLRSHKTYSAVARAPGGYSYTKRGILDADGKFTETTPGARPAITQGCIEVGMLTKTQNLERR